MGWGRGSVEWVVVEWGGVHTPCGWGRGLGAWSAGPAAPAALLCLLPRLLAEATRAPLPPLLQLGVRPGVRQAAAPRQRPLWWLEFAYNHILSAQQPQAHACACASSASALHPLRGCPPPTLPLAPAGPHGMP